MVDSLALRLFGERWWVELSGYADPDTYIARLRVLWSRVLDDSTGAADVVFRPVPDLGEARPALIPYIPDQTQGSFPYAFSRAVTQAAIDRHAGSALLLHAAGLVSEDERRGVVLVASSGTGKSTAARRLGQRLGYLSDELIMIDEHERLQGLTKPVSLIVPGFPGGKDESSPDELGLGPTPGVPPRLAAMVSLSRSAEAGDARLDVISVHELIAEIVPQTSSLWRVDRPLQRLAKAAQRGGGPFRLRYAEIVDAEPLMRRLLDADPLPDGVEDWIEHRPPESERWHAAAGVSSVHDLDEDTLITRGPWTDAIEQDDEVSVLAGPTFTRIAGIAVTIWLMCAQPLTVAELRAELARAHGPHPDADALMQSALRELVVRDLVRAVAIGAKP